MPLILESTYDFTLGVRPATRKGVPDGAGGFSHILDIPSIRLRFSSCHSVVNEQMAKDAGLTYDALVDIIKNHPACGKRFKIKSETNEETKVGLQRSNSPVVKGVRTSK